MMMLMMLMLITLFRQWNFRGLMDVVMLAFFFRRTGNCVSEMECVLAKCVEDNLTKGLNDSHTRFLDSCLMKHAAFPLKESSCLCQICQLRNWFC